MPPAISFVYSVYLYIQWTPDSLFVSFGTSPLVPLILCTPPTMSYAPVNHALVNHALVNNILLNHALVNNILLNHAPCYASSDPSSTRVTCNDQRTGHQKQTGLHNTWLTPVLYTIPLDRLIIQDLKSMGFKALMPTQHEQWPLTSSILGLKPCFTVSWPDLCSTVTVTV